MRAPPPMATSAASRTRRVGSRGRRRTSSISSNRRWRSETGLARRGQTPFADGLCRRWNAEERGLTPCPRKGSDPMPKRSAKGSDANRRKLVEFDVETWHALHLLSRDSMKSLQELADEAFADLLKKHHRPVTLKQALKESLRRQPANDPRAPRKR